MIKSDVFTKEDIEDIKNLFEELNNEKQTNTDIALFEHYGEKLFSLTEEQIKDELRKIVEIPSDLVVVKNDGVVEFFIKKNK